MAGRLRLSLLGEDEYTEWTEFVQGSPQGSVYSLPEYLDVLCSAAGGHFRILGARRGDDLVGGVALYERDSGGGLYVAPRLLLYYNGPVLRRYETHYPSERTARDVQTVTALAGWLGEAGYGRITLKCRDTVTDVRPFLAHGWTAWPSYTYVVPLEDVASLWLRVEQNLRRLVNRCANLGARVTEDTDFESFHRLHVATMDRKDRDVYLPEDRFRLYFERLHALGLCGLFHARLADGRAIASQLVLFGGFPVAHTVSAAGDAEQQATGANAFLRWRVFQALAAQGFSGNDLTDAALGPVSHFKSQLGGDLRLCLVLESGRTVRYRAHAGWTHMRDRAGAAASARLQGWRR